MKKGEYIEDEIYGSRWTVIGHVQRPDGEIREILDYENIPRRLKEKNEKEGEKRKFFFFGH